MSAYSEWLRPDHRTGSDAAVWDDEWDTPPRHPDPLPLQDPPASSRCYCRRGFVCWYCE